ncbi:NAD(P)H-dependent oxidoreductase [Galbibacter sp.]|uniref:NAD(P)H-dependent oxidoreductase n=1 Tax=Galbibacter sp. TaxID=2918471 RepID=UPI002BF74510|nr:NAD(P)H-dependent oxidoreductase [Galbibacter sp.]HLV64042.1 NAD(P)H-dependent oxidoreductase [Galbibacter sp.]
MSTYNKNLKWRYATKLFDATKKISDEAIGLLKEAIQLSASSYGLQPYKVLIISDPKVKEQLKEAAFGQPQLVDSSHVVVFANVSDLNAKHIASYIANIRKTRGLQNEQLEGFSNLMNSVVDGLSQDAREVWAAKQTYIALGNLLSAAADLKIDSCPMEGFDAAKVAQVLNLKELNLTPSVIAALGYRSAQDPTQHYQKVRKPEEELFITI